MAGALMQPLRIAILDDYQCVALTLANWGTLPTGTEVHSLVGQARTAIKFLRTIES